MKRFIVIFMVLLFTIMSGCNIIPSSEKPKDQSFISTSDELSELDLDNLEMSNFTVMQTEEVFFSNSDIIDKIYLLADYTEFGDEIYHVPYLAVALGSDLELIRLSQNESTGSFSDEMYICDIDGDKDEEIIIQQTVGMSGGAGQFVSKVFDFKEDSVVEVFVSSNLDIYDTGYYCITKNNYLIEIYNKNTDYVTTLNVSDKDNYRNVFFDKYGNVIKEAEVYCDSFYEFYPEDVNDDDVSELVCLQYLSLNGHSDYIGTAKSVLRYNVSLQQFEVVQTNIIHKQ